MVNLDDNISLASLNNPTPEIVQYYSDIPEIEDIDNRGYKIVRPLFAHSDFPSYVDIKRVRENEIDYKKPFIYSVYLHHNDALSAKHIYKLPEKVLQAAREGICKIILDNSLEGDKVYDFYTQLHFACAKYNIPVKQLYYITNSLVAKTLYQKWKEDNPTLVNDKGLVIPPSDKDLNVLPFMFNVHDIPRLVRSRHLPGDVSIQDEIKYKEENLSRIKTFLKVNRTGRAERDMFMLHINKYNMYDKFKISYPEFFNRQHLPKNLFPELVEESNIESLKKKVPFDIDKSDEENHGPPGVGKGSFNADLPFNPIHYRDTFISVVMCAFPFTRDACHLHSSTFNPMWCGHPVIQFGPYRHLELLKRKGFRTFSPWWDEDYDNIYFGWDRFKRILEIVDSLAKKTPEEMLEMYKDMHVVLEHNIQVMKDYNSKSVLRKFISYE